MTREEAIEILDEVKMVDDSIYGYYSAYMYALDMAIAALKAQVPRVMTLEKLQKIASIRDGAVWLEAGAGLMPAFMEFATKDITFFVAVPLVGYRQFFENDWYGKSWRCWDKKPTDAQREATPWEN